MVYVVPRVKVEHWLARLFGQAYPDLPHIIANASIRWMARWLSIPQFRAVTGPLVPSNTHLLSCNTLEERDAAIELVQNAFFRAIFTPKLRDSTLVIMYVHGGGFTSGSPEATSAYALQLSVELQQHGIIADVFSVGYNLAPESPYPSGLRQIVAAYEYLIAYQKPIVLMGDSAGGNLCLALLRHLHEPHPDIRAISHNSKSAIIALCLACPWVNLRNDRQPPQLLDGVDSLDKPTLDRWRSAYMDGKPLDRYTNPIDCTGGWKEILPPKALFMTGELDHFSRDIVQFVDMVRKAGHIGVDLVVAPLKGHAWNLVDFGAAKVGIPSSLIDTYVASYNGIMIQS